MKPIIVIPDPIPVPEPVVEQDIQPIVIVKPNPVNPPLDPPSNLYV